MKESMNQLQITALAREYAEWMIKDAKCEDMPNCLKKTMLASNTESAEEVIRWLLSRYNLVKKSAYDLGKQTETIKQVKDAEDTVIAGWVARNENNLLNAYSKKPIRQAFGDCLGWFGNIVMLLDESLFPDLTWDDEPQEVKIIIKKKKK